MRNLVIGCLVCLALLCVSFAGGYYVAKSRVRPIERIEVKVDTFVIEKPIPYTVERLRTEYITIPSCITDTVIGGISVELEQEAVKIALNVEQKTYRDSTYTAWVSGINAQLDSIMVYQRERTLTLSSPSKHRLGLYGSASYWQNASSSVCLGFGLEYVTPFNLYLSLGMRNDWIAFRHYVPSLECGIRYRFDLFK